MNIRCKGTLLALAVGVLFGLGLVEADAQWTLVGTNLYTNMSNYHVGIGTTTPLSLLHIHALGGSPSVWPKPEMRISTEIDHCMASGRVGVAYYDGMLYPGSRSGDFVITKLYGTASSGQCGDNMAVTTDAPNGSIILSTAGATGGAFPRMSVGDDNGHTFVDVKTPKTSYNPGPNNAMLRFYTCNGGGGLSTGQSLEGPWLVGIDALHSITGMGSQPIFRIGLDNRSTLYPGTSGGPSGLFNDGSSSQSFLSILRTGQVIIGKPLKSTSPRYYTTDVNTKLTVDGSIVANELWCVDKSVNWPDYVFSADYELMPLEEVERHIREKQHLPEIPSASEVSERGVGVMEMQAKLLQKVEELTLYVIEQQKQIKALKTELREQKSSE